MSAPCKIFFCDDQHDDPKGTWIEDLMEALSPQISDRFLLEHVESSNRYEEDGAVLVGHFLAKIGQRAGGARFCVVTDARFGNFNDGGARLLQAIVGNEKLSLQFHRGLVYSRVPDLGRATDDRIVALVRETTPGGVAYQSSRILRYLDTGESPSHHELLEFCRRLQRFLRAWYSAANFCQIPTEWDLGMRVSIFSPASVSLFREIDDSKSPRCLLPPGLVRSLHESICPYQSLYRASRFDWNQPPKGTADSGGWLRFAYELTNRDSFPSRIARYQDGCTRFEADWLKHQVKRLGLALDGTLHESPVFLTNLRIAIDHQIRLFDCVSKK